MNTSQNSERPSSAYLSNRGRGAEAHLPIRFERLHVEDDLETLEEMRRTDPDFEPRTVPTVFYKDDTRLIITRNSSPDLGFEASLNPYRGCEHGCAYCYARPYHEFLGMDAGLDFESKIVIKERAAELLEKELSNPRWEPRVLACSGVTDPYQPVERKLGITRACLEVLARFRNPVAIVTKNHLVTRDIDYLAVLAAEKAALVCLSVTTLDRDLAPVLEPRASSPSFRLDAVRRLSAAGIPVGVSLAPVIPGLNDHEMLGILEAAAAAGACMAFYTIVRLPHGVKDVFVAWLERHAPEKKEKVLGRIREMRGGALNDPRFGSRLRGEGIMADGIEAMFRAGIRRFGLERSPGPLHTGAFRRPGEERQLDLFG
ncbi:MAG TPA: PA0069 family radical SAM protein [Verrucomicrobiales bacterium]|nr:PA0069 family radical SAM protein [Verrucomicrobiales bacterium]